MEEIDRVSAETDRCGHPDPSANLGLGLLESVYETVLAASLARSGLKVDRQVPIDIDYDGMRFEAAFRIDLLVDDQLVVEIKSR